MSLLAGQGLGLPPGFGGFQMPAHYAPRGLLQPGPTNPPPKGGVQDQPINNSPVNDPNVGRWAKVQQLLNQQRVSPPPGILRNLMGSSSFGQRSPWGQGYGAGRFENMGISPFMAQGNPFGAARFGGMAPIMNFLGMNRPPPPGGYRPGLPQRNPGAFVQE